MTNPVSANPFRVLLVDDNVSVLKSLARVLEDDFDVTTCESSERAASLVRMNPYHVVCSDLEMPGMDGMALLRIVSELPLYTGSLLITGTDAHTLRTGTRHYVLLKPVDPERLISILTQLARVAEMKRSVRLMSTSLRAQGGRK